MFGDSQIANIPDEKIKSLMLSRSAVWPSLCSASTSVIKACDASASEDSMDSASELLVVVDRGDAKSDSGEETLIRKHKCKLFN